MQRYSENLPHITYARKKEYVDFMAVCYQMRNQSLLLGGHHKKSSYRTSIEPSIRWGIRGKDFIERTLVLFT